MYACRLAFQPRPLLSIPVLWKDEWRSLDFNRQDLEQQMRADCTLHVLDAVADVTGLEKEIAQTIGDSPVGQPVFHAALSHLTDSRTEMIVAPHVPTGSDGDLGNTKLVSTDKLLAWVEAVENDELEATRRVPGFHDEPLKGRRRGQRSIRRSRQWRAIYEIDIDLSVQIASVEEATPHAY